jgi:hypothetical protein
MEAILTKIGTYNRLLILSTGNIFLGYQFFLPQSLPLFTAHAFRIERISSAIKENHADHS